MIIYFPSSSHNWALLSNNYANVLSFINSLILKGLPKLRAMRIRMENGKECMKSYLHADLKKFKNSVYYLSGKRKRRPFDRLQVFIDKILDVQHN